MVPIMAHPPAASFARLRRTGPLLLAVALLSRVPHARANPQDIEEGEPVTLEDAFTDPAGQLSLQYSGTYTQTHDHAAKEQLEQGATIKLGAFPGVQISVNPSYDTGTTAERNAGGVLGDVLVQLNRQSTLLPAFAVDVFYFTPYGAAHSSAEYVVRLLATKPLGPSLDSPRLDLNLTDYHLTQPDRDGRSDQLQLVAGGSMLLHKNDAVVVDIVHGASEQQGQSETYLEAGYNRDLPDDWSLNVGIGKQVAGVARGLRIYFAIEKELDLF
jgi:hypothetical protein